MTDDETLEWRLQCAHLVKKLQGKVRKAREVYHARHKKL